MYNLYLGARRRAIAQFARMGKPHGRIYGHTATRNQCYQAMTTSEPHKFSYEEHTYSQLPPKLTRDACVRDSRNENHLEFHAFLRFRGNGTNRIASAVRVKRSMDHNTSPND